MNTNTDFQSLDNFVREKLRGVHTIKPAVVTKNTGHTVSVKVLTTTRYRDGTQLPLPTFDDVPLMIYAGTKGGARITVPVAEGDTVVVLFSDRDYSDLLDSSVSADDIFPAEFIEPFGLFPIMAIPMFFTEPEGEPIDTKNIVVENGSTKITVKPSGDIDIETPANANVSVGGDATIDVGGNVTTTVGGNLQGTITGSTTLVSSEVSVTAPQTTFTGNVSIAGTVQVVGPLSATTISSDNVDLDDHTHPYTWTDGAGSGNTGTPN